jgi:hypothetical protein
MLLTTIRMYNLLKIHILEVLVINTASIYLQSNRSLSGLYSVFESTILVYPSNTHAVLISTNYRDLKKEVREYRQKMERERRRKLGRAV